MSGVVAGDVCRLTVVTPKGSADLALPGGIPVGDLLPTLFRYADPEHAALPATGPGWVLQRAGEPALDPDGTVESLGLRDGEILHLRQESAALPPIQFDDLADGVATAVRQQPGRWRPELTRHLFLSAAGAVLGLVFVALLLAGPVRPRATVAGGCAVLLVAAGAVCSRALAQRVPAALLGVAAIPFGALCGWLSITGAGAPAAVRATVAGPAALAIGPATGPNLLAAGAAGTLVGVLGLVLVGVTRAVFLSATGPLAAAALGGGLATALELPAAGVAGLLATAALALEVWAPSAAAGLARLRLPFLPGDEQQLQQDIEPTPGREVLARAARAAGFLDVLSVTAGLVCAACFVVLAPAPGWAPPVLVAVLAGALLVRSRVLIGGWQRLAMAGAGAAGIASLTLVTIVRADPATRPWWLFAAAPAVAALVFGASYLPDRRLRPLWGRAADLAETLLGLLAIPVLVQVLGLYAWARSLGG
jgi:type VII secretion integral membrane protein EccD